MWSAGNTRFHLMLLRCHRVSLPATLKTSHFHNLDCAINNVSHQLGTYLYISRFQSWNRRWVIQVSNLDGRPSLDPALINSLPWHVWFVLLFIIVLKTTMRHFKILDVCGDCIRKRRRFTVDRLLKRRHSRMFIAANLNCCFLNKASCIAEAQKHILAHFYNTLIGRSIHQILQSERRITSVYVQLYSIWFESSVINLYVLQPILCGCQIFKMIDGHLCMYLYHFDMTDLYWVDFGPVNILDLIDYNQI